MKSHSFKPHKAAATVSWPSFSGTATFVGTSPSGKVSVYYDASLGAAALKNADDLLAEADSIVADNDAIFGTKGGSVNVIVFALNGATDGTGGADHMACDYVNGQNIEVCASFGNSNRVYGLFEAELSECSMNGNLCGENTGEALSRWCASSISNNALSDFATAPTWFADGAQDYVTTTDPTDQNPDSTGCGMAFISWLMSLGHKLPEIAAEMVKLGDQATFAGTYAALTGDAIANAWNKFHAAVVALPNGVTSDDPFSGSSPAPTPTPTPTPTPGTSAQQLGWMILEVVAADMVNGSDEPTMKADVQSILDAN